MGKIGKYTTERIIGEGGMGKIYKAKDPAKKPVVIKQLTLTTKEIFTKRFEREAKIMKAFNHRNIVKVFDIFSIGSSYYIVMEYIDGLTIEQLIKNKKQISPLAAILIFEGICKGIKYAHDRNVIHRDMKPENVLISKNGVVKILDFGIASVDSNKGEALTNTGVIMGTPAYMSPEQLTDAKYLDKRTDIYSIGAIFYKMLTGANAFPSAYVSTTFRKINRGEYEPPKKLNSKIDNFHIKIIKNTMNNNIKKRYKDLEYLIKILSKHTALYGNQKQIENAIKNYLSGTEIDTPSVKVKSKLITPKKSILKKSPIKKKTPKKLAAKKPAAKKPTSKKTTTKKKTPKKNVTKKPAAKKPTSKKTTTKKKIPKKNVTKKPTNKKILS